jgi:hypothetical protein
MSKIFREEIIKLFDRLKSKTPFSFSKYADGEWSMMRNIPIIVQHNEFSFNENDIFYKDKLIESFKYKHERYFVGISCPCCQGVEFENMKTFSEQNDSNLTFANIFVNSNYSFYNENFIPEYNNWDIHLIGNSKSNINLLPFKVEEFYPVEDTAWRQNYDLIDKIKKLKLSNKLFLFACGPFGNMLAHQLWDDNKSNTYLDIGSTLNPLMLNGLYYRDYFNKNSVYANRECVWG